MMTTAVATDIREFVQRRHRVSELEDSTDIFALGFINSLFAMQLVLFLENRFGIRIPNDELVLDNLRTVTAMTGLVERQLATVTRSAP
jgi:acyl carrier protein